MESPSWPLDIIWQDKRTKAMNVNKLIKYNLEIMTAILAAFMVIGFMNWSELSQLRQMTVIFMLLYTLHEWEESRFPGGFYRIFFSKCTIDPTISEERLHLPVAVYLLVILIIPVVFDSIAEFALVPLILALFEGFIHTAGIIIHQLKRPYSPGMITAWMMFAYAVIMIPRLNEELMLNAWSWISGILLTIISFFIMETRFMKGAGITIKEFQTNMKNHMLKRIKGEK